MTNTAPSAQPESIVFVCQSNRGKSAMAAGLFAKRAADASLSVHIYSAGTRAEDGTTYNEESAESLARVSATMGAPDQAGPRRATAEMLGSADRVIVVGGADLSEVSGFDAATSAHVSRWTPAEPSEEGFEGAERMDLLRDRIDAYVTDLVNEITAAHGDTENS